MSIAVDLVEKGYIPDFLTRIGIRRLLGDRLNKEKARRAHGTGKSELAQKMSQSPLALNTDDANDQHYEVPASFFKLMLGPRLKYSCALYDEQPDEGKRNLQLAEEEMLALSCNRAAIHDGHSILELGCGWGSLSLYMAEKYPASKIVAVSNSASQKDFIMARAQELSLDNLQIITCDMNDFSTTDKFDRVISIEMFEHMRNYKLLFQRISNWLEVEGKLFFHIFCHNNMPYFFEVESESDWMSENFFTGGIMPSFDLPDLFSDDLVVENRWKVNGQHYAKTCQAWLQNLDSKRKEAMDALGQSGNPESLVRQFNRWRMFVMACEELFGYNRGDEWHVGHFLMSARKS